MTLATEKMDSKNSSVCLFFNRSTLIELQFQLILKMSGNCFICNTKHFDYWIFTHATAQQQQQQYRQQKITFIQFLPCAKK